MSNDSKQLHKRAAEEARNRLVAGFCLTCFSVATVTLCLSTYLSLTEYKNEIQFHQISTLHWERFRDEDFFTFKERVIFRLKQIQVEMLESGKVTECPPYVFAYDNVTDRVFKIMSEWVKTLEEAEALCSTYDMNMTKAGVFTDA